MKSSTAQLALFTKGLRYRLRWWRWFLGGPRVVNADGTHNRAFKEQRRLWNTQEPKP